MGICCAGGGDVVLVGDGVKELRGNISFLFI